MKRITSRQNSLIRQYRDARGGRTDRILLDGPHLLAEALRAGIAIEHAIVDAGAIDGDEVAGLVADLHGLRTEVALGVPAVMAAVSPLRSPSPIVALAARPADAGVRLYEGATTLVVIACGIQDPGNLGALVRVSEAGSASGVVAAGASADPFGWRALRGSMGSALRLPVAICHDPRDAVADARAHGCRIVALIPRTGRSLYRANLSGALTILAGNEGSGVPEDVIANADERVTIPMAPPVESLNTAVSAALVIYEVWRRRLPG